MAMMTSIQVLSVEQKKDYAEEQEFPTHVAKSISEAYRDFENHSRQMECYNFYLKKDEDTYTVSFLRKYKVIPAKNSEIVVGLLNTEECKRGISYLYDSKTGRLIKKINQR
jgi:hypothetical protein